VLADQARRGSAAHRLGRAWWLRWEAWYALFVLTARGKPQPGAVVLNLHRLAVCKQVPGGILGDLDAQPPSPNHDRES
jgi:hypothetical protein